MTKCSWIALAAGLLLGSAATAQTTGPTLHEHGMSCATPSGTLDSGESVTLAFGVPFSGAVAWGAVGWLHHHPPIAGNDCPPDLDNDGVVATSDLLLLLADFGCTNSCAADINGDGLVSSADLLSLLAAYGDFCQT